MKGKYLIPAATAALAVLAVISACIGSFPLSVSQIIDIVQGDLTDCMESRVFWNLRLPRVFMGMAAGAVLSLAGAIYQTIFRNPLASPDLTGVASGASFGAACAIVMGTGRSIEIMAGSFLMGLLSLVLVLLLVRASKLQQMGSYILAGIIVSSISDAGLMILKYMADPERELAAIEFWIMGSLGSITAEKAYPQFLFILAPLFLLLLFHRQAIILSLGTEHARAMGLDPKLWRGIFLGLSTLMIAAVVCVTGTIAFVGLIAPHLAFMILKRRNRDFFILSSLIGSGILLIADVLARSLAGGAELPLSIMTILLSVPMLIFLLCGKRGENHERIL